ncbi:MAG: hypothetical protein AB7I42_03875 [Bradyrhizobium sp.]|uniref:hypothetical protein n=1 Tax=Bradyrhizobium sp. TaxID=376 RepID=UPI003D0E21C3
MREGATASVIAHLSLLALLVLVSEVKPLDQDTESIAVNIVTPNDVEAERLKPADPPQPDLPDPPAPAEPALSESKVQAPAAPPAPAAPQQSATPPPAAQQRQDGRSAAAPSKTEIRPAAGGYRQPEPDISVKYNVMLGLPPELPLPGPSKSDAGFDETTVAADISSTALVEFRRHLKTCSKLPASVGSSDHVVVKLRVFLAQDGRLAADPVVGGGSANPKAIELLRSAIAALRQCQPYVMLPPDRYGEWKVLDLDFTPKDFSG